MFSIHEGKYPGQVKSTSALYYHCPCFQSYSRTGIPDLQVHGFPLAYGGKDCDSFLKLLLKCFCPSPSDLPSSSYRMLIPCFKKEGSRPTVFCTATMLRTELDCPGPESRYGQEIYLLSKRSRLNFETPPPNHLLKWILWLFLGSKKAGPLS